MRPLSEIQSFGGTAAEDDDIKRFFVRTPAFADLLDGKKHLVLGRKGSGKTALYLALDNYAKENGRPSVGLTFSQYPWEAHYKYAANEVTSTERFVASWTFLILAEVFALLLDRPPEGLTRSQRKALTSVQKFIEDNYGTNHFDFKAAFPSGGLSVSEVDIRPEVARTSMGTVRARREGASLGATLSRVNDWLLAKLLIIGPNVPMTFILFDELDLGFDPRNAEYRDRVIGLLLAARSLLAKVTRNGIPVHPVLFLRSDIFDLLHFGDKNKIVNAEALELVWHDELNYVGASLKHLIDWRIKEELQVARLDAAWSAAFDEQLTRGTQHKFQHMTYRTYLRPRDVIQFANLALQMAQRRYVLENGGDARIGNQDLKEARVPYSKYFRRELDDEIAEAEPDWQSLLEILRSIGAARFAKGDFDRGYRTAMKKADLGRSSEECLAFLYNYSILGFERAVTGAGILHHFRYRDESVVFEPDAPSFLIHGALKETLGLTETLQDD